MVRIVVPAELDVPEPLLCPEGGQAVYGDAGVVKEAPPLKKVDNIQFHLAAEQLIFK